MRSWLAASLMILTTVGVIAAQSPREYERIQTSRIVGVAITDLSSPKNVAEFADLSSTALPLKFRLSRRPLTGPLPAPTYENRQTVKASAPNGTTYEGWSGRYSDGKVYPGRGENSTNANPRQRYALHHGYAFNPADVFIGRREGPKIRTLLFFRDVGSHETAPYHFTVDSRGLVNLIVSDVNISDNNELNVYALVGDPASGKWLAGTMLDRRGFTSWSHPWSGSSGETVHFLWNWGDATFDRTNQAMGLFYVDRSSNGYGKKIRIVDGLVESYGAAIDSGSGNLMIAARVGEEVYVAMRKADSTWLKPTRLNSAIATMMYDLSLTSTGNGSFVVRGSGSKVSEWVIRPGPN
ncbi:MAG TPA: hypothetical protein VNA22_06920 [Pyrinomonadaceae bacterium]|nr:hypothetical protein [Pyrinomonadaceae bacterium]